MNNLFVYGTLLCEDIFITVSGCRRRVKNCSLKNFRRVRIRGEHYPGIIPVPGNRVEGLLYSAVPPPAWSRLDRFEGDMYRRQPVEVELHGGGLEKAFAYVVRTEFFHCLEPRKWDLSEFLAAGRKPFGVSYRGYAELVKDNLVHGE